MLGREQGAITAFRWRWKGMGRFGLLEKSSVLKCS